MPCASVIIVQPLCNQTEVENAFAIERFGSGPAVRSQHGECGGDPPDDDDYRDDGSGTLKDHRCVFGGSIVAK